MKALHSIPIYTESRTTYWFRHVLGRIVKRAKRRAAIAQDPSLITFPNDVIGREIAVSGIYEKAGIEAIRHMVRARVTHSGNTHSIFLDIGANIGVYSASLSSSFSHVVCVEPNLLTARILELNLEINQVHNAEIIRVGLSNSAGEAFLEVPNADNLGGARISSSDRGSRIPIGKGDDVLADACSRGNLGLVKIDIEGHEGPAIDGMTRTIARHHPVIAFEANSPESDGVMSRLRELDYVVFLALTQRPVSRNWFVNVTSATLFGARNVLHPIRDVGESRYSLVFALTADHAEKLASYEASCL